MPIQSLPQRPLLIVTLPGVGLSQLPQQLPPGYVWGEGGGDEGGGVLIVSVLNQT